MLPLNRRQFLASTAISASALAGRTLAESPAPQANPVPATINAFNWDIFRELSGKPGNVFQSALSIEAAFAMAAAGAKGETLSQMQKALHLPTDATALHAGFQSLLAKLNLDKIPVEKRGFELKIANALWGSNAYPWRPEFLKVTTNNYGGGLMETDFSQPEAARAKINKWVETQTREKIKDLFPQGSIDTATRLAITNAIYFKGKWEREFDKKLSKAGPFTQADGKKVEATLMQAGTGLPYAESETWQAVELAYVGRETSMLIVLPRKIDGLPELQKSLTAAKLEEIAQSLRYQGPVNVTIPRFKVETKYDLKPPLQSLGIKDAFAANADFTGMHSGSERLFISTAIHQAFVEVNEEGTEAAAATGIAIARASSAIPQPPKVFRADHPFLFAIRHKPTNAILFFGKLESVK